MMMNKPKILSKFLIGISLLFSSGVCFGKFGNLRVRLQLMQGKCRLDINSGYLRQRRELFQVLDDLVRLYKDSLELYHHKRTDEPFVGASDEGMGQGSKKFCNKKDPCEVCLQIASLPSEYACDSFEWRASLIERAVCYLGALYNDADSPADKQVEFEYYLKSSGAQRLFEEMKATNYAAMRMSRGSYDVLCIMNRVHGLMSFELGLQKRMQYYIERLNQIGEPILRSSIYKEKLFFCEERVTRDCSVEQVQQACSPFRLTLNNRWATSYEDFWDYISEGIAELYDC